MSYQFYQSNPVVTVDVPEVGSDVRIWLRSNGNNVGPQIVEGTVRTVYTYEDSGALNALVVIDNDLNYHTVQADEIGSIEIA